MSAPKTPHAQDRKADRPSPLELAVMAIFVALGCVIPILVFFKVQTEGLHWSGAIGGPAEDTMQYLAWIRESGHHLLAGDLFTLAPPVRDYLNPGVAISALLFRIGIPIPITYALWVPIAAVVICLGAFRFVSLILERGIERAVALAFGLFFAFPVGIASGLIPADTRAMFDLVAPDASTLNPLWGYPYSALAIGLATFALVRFAQVRGSGRSFDLSACALTLFAGWLQPWQGFTVAATVIAVEAVGSAPRFRESASLSSNRSSRLVALTVAASAALPLAYYLLLNKFDLVWKDAGLNLAAAAPGEKWWMPILTLLPLLIPALVVVRIPITSPAELIARLWPAIAISEAIVMGIAGIGDPSHALRGSAIPLAVLAVVGASRVASRLPRAVTASIAVAAFVAFCAIATTDKARTAIDGTDNGSSIAAVVAGTWLSDGELSALDSLDKQAPAGAVFGGREKLASMVPWRTGRQVWIGHTTWSPFSNARFQAQEIIGRGHPCCSRTLFYMPSARFVSGVGARYLLTQCYQPLDRILVALGDGVQSVRRFGCVAVIQLKPSSFPTDRRLIESFYGR